MDGWMDEWDAPIPLFYHEYGTYICALADTISKSISPTQRLLMGKSDRAV